MKRQQSTYITAAPDGYSRYFWIQYLLKQVFHNKQISVLDVGGKGTFFHEMFGSAELSYTLTVADILPPPDEKTPYPYVQCDATEMQFQKNTFDAVVSTDVLEHVDPGKKLKFIDECYRVARSLVIIAFPYQSAEVHEAEQLADDFYRQLTGKNHRWLSEHFEMQKPSVEKITAHLRSKNLKFEWLGTNSLDNWLLTVLANFIHEKYPVQTIELEELNRFYNENILQMGDLEGIPYRNMLIIYKDEKLHRGIVRHILDIASRSKIQKFRQRYVSYFSTFAKKNQIVEDLLKKAQAIRNQTVQLKEIIRENKNIISQNEQKIGELQAQLDHRTYELYTVKTQMHQFQDQLRRVQNTYVWRAMHSKKLPLYYLHRLYQKYKQKHALPIPIEEKNNSSEHPKNTLSLHERELQQYLTYIQTIPTPPPNLTISTFKISVITPVYNTDPKYLEECVCSVLNQTYTNWEHILVNDASTKAATLQKLKQLEKKDSRIVVIHCKENARIAGATNAGMRSATGTHIGFLDHDDMLAPRAFAATLSAFAADPDVCFTFSDKDLFEGSLSNRLNPLFKPEMSEVMLFSANYLTHFTVFKKECISEIGDLDPATDGAQDWDYYLRAIATGKKWVRIPEVLYHWRIHKESTSTGLDSKPYAQKNQMHALTKFCERKHYPAKGAVDGHKNKIMFTPPAEEERVSIHILSSDVMNTRGVLNKIINQTQYRNFSFVVHGASGDAVGIRHTKIRYASDSTRLIPDFHFLSEEKRPYAVVLSDLIVPDSPFWLDELLGFFRLYPKLKSTTGKIVMNTGCLFSTIRQIRKGNIIRQFDQYPNEYFGIIGSTEWYWEMIAPLPVFMATVQREYSMFSNVRSWEDYYGCFIADQNPGDPVSIYNPFARMKASDEDSLRALLDEPEQVSTRLYRRNTSQCEKMLNPHIAYSRSELTDTTHSIQVFC